MRSQHRRARYSPTPTYPSKPNFNANYDTWNTVNSKLTFDPNIIKALSKTGLGATFNIHAEHHIEPPPSYPESNAEQKPRDAKARSGADAHIEQMHNRVSSIRRDFESIRLTIRKFDIEMDKSAHLGVENQKLEPQWMTLHEEFENVLLSSRRVATHAASLAKDYHETVVATVQDEGETHEVKLEEVQQYIREVDDTETKAADLARDFGRLKSNVRVFTVTIEQATKKTSENLDELNDEIETTRAAIKVLHEKLDLLGQSVMHANLASYHEPEEFSLSAGCSSFLAVFFDYSWQDSLNVSKAKRRSEEIFGLQDDLANKLGHLNKLLKDQNSLRVVQASFQIASIQLDEICKSIDTLGTIWGILRFDANMLSISLTKLQNKHKNKNARPKQFHDALQKCTESYQALENSLSMYAANLPLE